MSAGLLGAARGAQFPDELRLSYAPIVQRVAPAVVNVYGGARPWRTAIR